MKEKDDKIIDNNSTSSNNNNLDLDENLGVAAPMGILDYEAILKTLTEAVETLKYKLKK